jgi:Inner membrane protein YgaP-like, transmembrane domain
MKVNEHVIDRTLRVIAGLVLIGLAASGTVGVWGWIGVVPLLTGLVGFCPGYAIFGMSTCTMKKT